MSAAGTDAGSNAAFCLDLVRAQDFDRYASTLFVTPTHRRALLALYAFNVEIVRVREQVSQPLPGEIRLQWWTDTLGGLAHGGIEGNPVAAELFAAIETHALPVAPLTALIEAHVFDLYNDPMPDMALAEGYLEATSSALLALAARILGGSAADDIGHLARHAGIASGLTLLLARLPLDAARRQLFVPQDVLVGHGVVLDELFAGSASPALRAAVTQLRGEARAHLDAAMTLLRDAPAATRRAFVPLALVRRDLAAMADTDPLKPPQRSRLATLWTLWRASKSRAFK